MASFAPPQSGSRGIPPPGLRPRPGMSGPMRTAPRGLANPGASNPYGNRPRPGMTSQRALTPEILASIARRRLGG